MNDNKSLIQHLFIASMIQYWCIKLKFILWNLSHADETLNLRNLKRSAFMPGIIQIDDINQSQALLGNNDENLKAIEAC